MRAVDLSDDHMEEGVLTMGGGAGGPDRWTDEALSAFEADFVVT